MILLDNHYSHKGGGCRTVSLEIIRKVYDRITRSASYRLLIQL